MELLTKAALTPEETARERENREIAYRCACEAMVLLENKGVLPLQSRKVALYGPGATRTTKGGTGSGEVNERHSVTILEGLCNRGFQVTSRRWLQDYERDYERLLEEFRARRRAMARRPGRLALAQAKLLGFQPPQGRAITAEDVRLSDTDTCIYVLSRQAGEGRDRKETAGDYYLTEEEKAAIRTCAENYRNFVVLLNCGAAVDTGFLEETDGVGAVVYISQLGTQGGNACADLLSGAVSPSGALASTWAKSYGDIPFAGEFSYLNGDLEQENYKEGIYVGYRYFDSFRVSPRYPFGYGLTYSEFSVECAGVELEGSRVRLEAEVSNRGSFPGKKIVQLYASAPAGKLDREYQSLAAFGKTAVLQSGETARLGLEFDLRALGGFREEDNCFVLEPGEYVLRLGSHSRDTKVAAVLTLEKEVILSRHDPVCTAARSWADLTSPSLKGEERTQAPVLRIDPAALETVVYEYRQPEPQVPERVTRFVDSLTPSEMVDVLVGAGELSRKVRFKLPGSVGNTTAKLWDKGLANVALCDGPAGLRIQRTSTVTKYGWIRAVEHNLSLVELMPKPVRNLLTGDPSREQGLYQYTTAFPVTAAMAQSWNTELLYEMGKAVYTEMKEYGCSFWLAPAINIHRNPLCGRNFEYFSEDPFLTGALAAALTRGVQQEDGFYVTVKHFACNNQEDNRLYVSSNVSQRALREIYLRAFEMVVREGRAGAVMTSYNRLNGVYTANSYDLCTKLLRNEWGFDGVVMTDWDSTAPDRGSDPVCMQVGNDLIMPGGSKHRARILKAVKDGSLSKEDLRRCCLRVVRAIFASDIQKEYID